MADIERVPFRNEEADSVAEGPAQLGAYAVPGLPSRSVIVGIEEEGYAVVLLEVYLVSHLDANVKPVLVIGDPDPAEVRLAGCLVTRSVRVRRWNVLPVAEEAVNDNPCGHRVGGGSSQQHQKNKYNRILHSTQHPSAFGRYYQHASSGPGTGLSPGMPPPHPAGPQYAQRARPYRIKITGKVLI
jgi:hypothetical protein